MMRMAIINKLFFFLGFICLPSSLADSTLRNDLTYSQASSTTIFPYQKFIQRNIESSNEVDLTNPRMLDETTALSTMFFVGIWQINEANNDSKLFDRFEHRQGKISMSFNEGFQIEDQLIWYKQPIPEISVYYVQMQIIDGDYYDNSREVITINDLSDINFDSSTNIFTVTKGNIDFYPDTGCNLTIQIDFTGISPSLTSENQTYDTNTTGPIKALATSPNCKLNFAATMQIESQDYSTRVINLIIFHEIILIVIVYTNMKLIKRLYKSTAESNRVSMAEPVYIGIWDLVFVTNMHMISTESTLVISFIVFCINLMLLIFTSILLLVTPMVKRTQTIDINIFISSFLKLVCFYGFLPVLLMVLVLRFSVSTFFHPIFLFSTNLYLLPQIIHNIAKGIPVLFEPHTIAYIISLRPLISFYFKACPSNIYGLGSSSFVVAIIVTSIGAQVIFLYLQAKYGVRFFIPKKIHSNDYSYFHDQSEESSATELIKIVRTCNICLGKLSKAPNLTEQPDMEAQSILERIKAQPETVMNTECKHKFHAICLIEWMKDKMECPMCGFVLRPI